MTTPILMYRSIGETVPRGLQCWMVRPAWLRAQVRGLAEASYATFTVRARWWSHARRAKSHSPPARERQC